MTNGAHLVRLLIALVLATAVACSSTTSPRVFTVSGDNVSRTVRVPSGSELRIVLFNVGPGTFESPPSISAPILQFLGDSVIPPYTPAGPTQQFRFSAINSGSTIVHFRRTGGFGSPTVVEDTVEIY